MRKLLTLILLISTLSFAASCTKSVKLTFDPCNGETSYSVTIKKGDVPPVSSPVSDNMFFGGWWTEKEGGGTQWIPGKTELKDKATLYACWLNTMLTVSFEHNLPEGEEAVAKPTPAQKLSYGANAIRPEEPELKLDNYYFYNWSLSPDTYEPYGFTSVPVYANLTLYAFWSEYKILSFHANLPEGEQLEEVGKLLDDRKVRQGGSVSLPNNLKTVSRMSWFEGWYLNEELTDRWYSRPITENTAVYASWSAAVKITFETNSPLDALVDWNKTSEFIIKKNMSLRESFYNNYIKDAEWLLSRYLIPSDKNYNYAPISWFYTNSSGEEKNFTPDLRMNESTTVYVKWRKANFYKFDGIYYELFHPEITEGKNIFASLGTLPEY